MKKQWVLYLLAFIITVSAAIYQRLTGPTHPKRVTFHINDNKIGTKLLRSSNNDKDAEIVLPDALPPESEPVLVWRYYPSKENWHRETFNHGSEGWVAYLPKQPAAGKVEYYIEYRDGDKTRKTPEHTAVVLRFKEPVPAWVLIPHVFFMFLAMFFSNLMGIESIVGNEKYYQHAIVTAVTLGIGGFILGPLMQWYAFGELWTGVPFGWDLTDNKTLIAMIGLLFGLWKSKKTGNPKWILLSSIIILLVYLIPHSVMGSELDYKTGKVMTG